MEQPPELILNINEIWGAEWLKCLFHVAKYTADQKMGALMKKERVWGIDFYMKTFSQLPCGRSASETWASTSHNTAKTHLHSALYRVEREPCDERRLRLRFFKAEHPYDLVYASGTDRQRFYECAKALRQFPVWCPALVPRGRDRSIVIEINGGLETKVPSGFPGEKQYLSGIVKLRPSPLPTEDVRLWTGSKDLRGTMPNQNDLLDWMPRGVADIYVAAFQDIPLTLQKTTQLGEMISRHLGEEYVPLLSTELEGSRRSVAIIVICTKPYAFRVSNTGAWTGSLTRTPQTKSSLMTLRQRVKGKSDQVVSDMVAISFSVNETTMLFASTKVEVSSDDVGEIAVQVRHDILRDLFTKMEIGPSTGGDVLNKFHHCFVLGGLGYGSEVENHVWTRKSALPRNCDRLSREVESANCLAGFNENDLIMNSSIGAENLCQRILWRSLSGAVIKAPHDAYRVFCHSGHVMSPAVANMYVVSSQLTWLEAFSTPTPNRMIRISDVELTCEAGKPGAWEVSGKLLPKHPQLCVWTDWSESATVRVSMSPATEQCLTYRSEPIPPLMPTTHSKPFLERQYLWFTLQHEGEVYGSGVVPLGGVTRRENEAPVPVDMRLKRGGLRLRAKLTFTLQVTTDPASILAALATLDSKEVPKRTAVMEDERTQRAVILSLMEPDQDEVSGRMWGRHANERADIEKREHAGRGEVYTEVKAAIKYLYQVAASISGNIAKDREQQQRFARAEEEYREMVAVSEEKAWRDVLHLAERNLLMTRRLSGDIKMLWETEHEMRNGLATREQQDRARLSTFIAAGLLSAITLLEDIPRQQLVQAEEESRGAVNQAFARGLVETRQAEHDSLISKQAAEREDFVNNWSSAERQRVEDEEGSERDKLREYMAEHEVSVEQAAVLRWERQLEAQRTNAELLHGKEADEIAEEEAREFEHITKRASGDLSSASKASDRRKQWMQSYRDDIILDADDIREEVEQEETAYWDMLLKEEAAERIEIKRTAQAAGERKTVAEMVRYETEQRQDVMRDEHEQWTDLVFEEQQARAEARDRKLGREDRDKRELQKKETAARESVALKEQSCFEELIQALEVEGKAAGRREAIRLQAETDRRLAIEQEEETIFHALMQLERRRRKDVRRAVQTRSTRELQRITDLRIDEEAERGEAYREEARLWKQIQMDISHSIANMNMVRNLQLHEQHRALQELPWFEERKRNEVLVEEDRGWWALVHALAADRKAAVGDSILNQLLSDDRSFRGDTEAQEEAQWEEMMSQSFAERQETLRKSIADKAENNLSLDDAEFMEGTERRDRQIEQLRELEEYLFSFEHILRTDISDAADEAYTRGKAAENRSRKSAQRKTEQRLLLLQEVVWGEEAGRTAIERHQETVSRALFKMEPEANVAAHRPLQSLAPEYTPTLSPDLPCASSEDDGHAPHDTHRRDLQSDSDADLDEYVEPAEDPTGRQYHVHSRTRSHRSHNHGQLDASIQLIPRRSRQGSAKRTLTGQGLEGDELSDSGNYYTGTPCSSLSLPPTAAGASADEAAPPLALGSTRASRGGESERRTSARQKSEITLHGKASSLHPVSPLARRPSSRSEAPTVHAKASSLRPTSPSPRRCAPAGSFGGATAENDVSAEETSETPASTPGTGAAAKQASSQARAPSALSASRGASGGRAGVEFRRVSSRGMRTERDDDDRRQRSRHEVAVETECSFETGLAEREGHGGGRDVSPEEWEEMDYGMRREFVRKSSSRFILRMRTLFEDESHHRTAVTRDEMLCREVADFSASPVFPPSIEGRPDEHVASEDGWRRHRSASFSTASATLPPQLCDAFPLRAPVEARNMLHARELNGARGTVVGYDNDRVLVDFGEAHPTRGIKPQHLVCLPPAVTAEIDKLAKRLRVEQEQSAALRAKLDEQTALKRELSRLRGELDHSRSDASRPAKAAASEEGPTPSPAQRTLSTAAPPRQGSAAQRTLSSTTAAPPQRGGAAQRTLSGVSVSAVSAHRTLSRRSSPARKADRESSAADPFSHDADDADRYSVDTGASIASAFKPGAAVESSGHPIVRDNTRGTLLSLDLEASTARVEFVGRHGVKEVPLQHLTAAASQDAELNAARREIKRLQNLLTVSFTREYDLEQMMRVEKASAGDPTPPKSASGAGEARIKRTTSAASKNRDAPDPPDVRPGHAKHGRHRRRGSRSRSRDRKEKRDKKPSAKSKRDGGRAPAATPADAAAAALYPWTQSPQGDPRASLGYYPSPVAFPAQSSPWAHPQYPSLSVEPAAYAGANGSHQPQPAVSADRLASVLQAARLRVENIRARNSATAEHASDSPLQITPPPLSEATARRHAAGPTKSAERLSSPLKLSRVGSDLGPPPVHPPTGGSSPYYVDSPGISKQDSAAWSAPRSQPDAGRALQAELSARRLSSRSQSRLAHHTPPPSVPAAQRADRRVFVPYGDPLTKTLPLDDHQPSIISLSPNLDPSIDPSLLASELT